ncbi:MAG TPA: hypothetical protein VN249_05235 [Prolixibacteraceae bacterium]|nr:hypothetical protein [Prolixibacteraceae bacterium]
MTCEESVTQLSGFLPIFAGTTDLSLSKGDTWRIFTKTENEYMGIPCGN